MSANAIRTPPATAPATIPTPDRAHALYRALMRGEDGRQAGRAFLCDMLDSARRLPNDLPDDINDLPAWSQTQATEVGHAYAAYLAERKQGGPRHYFATRAHAMYFIRHVAPSKLVDGAWLYAVLSRWEEPACHGLIRTYLEELGDGVPGQNHVVLYQKLLASLSCDQPADLPDDRYVQGAIQLALARYGAEFMPEVVGFNLGYEQLPLHLLISAYELNELGIDPYYFSLHVTIDNAGSGHAQKAVAAVERLMPAIGNQRDFYARVRAGFNLNDLGAGTLSVIASFDLEEEVIAVLTGKSVQGRNMHSDFCRVAGRSINDWLSNPREMPAFLAALTGAGWIERGKPATASKFWQLLQGERAPMFGAFDAYELQVLRDWIESPVSGSAKAPRIPSYRAQLRLLDQLGGPAHSDRAEHQGLRGLIRRHAADLDAQPGCELRALEERIAALPGKAAAMRELIVWMAPRYHHTPVGLMATRMYAQLLDT
ncbi:MAG: iron-containing redox enzyme family protein [Massilia sp.]